MPPDRGCRSPRRRAHLGHFDSGPDMTSGSRGMPPAGAVRVGAVTWWMWVLIWAVLLVGAAAVLGWCGWRVFRSGVRLGRAVGESADRAAAAQSAAVSDGPSPSASPVTGTPTSPDRGH